MAKGRATDNTTDRTHTASTENMSDSFVRIYCCLS